MSRILCVVNPPTPKKLSTHRCLQTAIYELGPLSNGSNYVTPQKNDTDQKKCGCNTIIYSLYASCAICQFAPTATPIT